MLCSCDVDVDVDVDGGEAAISGLSEIGGIGLFTQLHYLRVFTQSASGEWVSLTLTMKNILSYITNSIIRHESDTLGIQ